MNTNEVERIVSAWLAGEAPRQAPDRILSEVRMRVKSVDRSRFWSWRTALFAAGAVTATMVLAVVGSGLLRSPSGLGAPTPPIAVATTAPPSSQPTPTDYPSAIPTPTPSPTVDITGRDAAFAVYAGDPDATYLLAGTYLVSGTGAAGNKLCGIVVVAIDATYTGDLKSYYGMQIGLIAFTGAAGSFFSFTDHDEVFPRGQYRFVAGSDTPVGPYSRDGTIAQCPEWSLSFVAQ